VPECEQVEDISLRVFGVISVDNKLQVKRSTRYPTAGYSWPTWGYVLRVPIDNCFVSNDVAVTGHHDGPNVGSDHRPLVVDISVG
jgi:endonuclease/exonuclease/phosphatase (EEP) superfamily protein YafD